MFSTIEDNHIYNIAIKREFYGYEIGGIKLHAAIDVIIRHNRIHDCSLGIWLDWQTQGTRVSRNLFYANNRDLFVEVSHGPYLVDHNILASPASLELFSQGGAFVNNLVCGTVCLEPVLDRPTPYHVPHSTQVAGYAAIHGGDDRYIGNIFLGGDPALAYGPTVTTGARAAGHGTAGYDGHPASMEDYLALGGRSRPAATTSASRTSSSRSTSATTSTPPGPKPFEAETGRDRPRPATTSPPRSSTKAPRSTWSASCRPPSTTSASAPSAEPTSNASASSTPTSRSPTAPRSSWTPTWSGPTRPRPAPTRPARSPPSPQAAHASACGSNQPNRPQQRTRDNKLSFGLWIIGWQARDMFDQHCELG